MPRLTWELADDEWAALQALVGLMGAGVKSPQDVLRVAAGALCARFDAPVGPDTFALDRQPSLFELQA